MKNGDTLIIKDLEVEIKKLRQWVTDFFFLQVVFIINFVFQNFDNLSCCGTRHYQITLS